MAHAPYDLYLLLLIRQLVFAIILLTIFVVVLLLLRLVFSEHFLNQFIGTSLCLFGGKVLFFAW